MSKRSLKKNKNSLHKHVESLWNRKYAIITSIVFMVLIITYITYKLKHTVKKSGEIIQETSKNIIEDTINNLNEMMTVDENGKVDIKDERLKNIISGLVNKLSEETIKNLEEKQSRIKEVINKSIPTVGSLLFRGS